MIGLEEYNQELKQNAWYAENFIELKAIIGEGTSGNVYLTETKRDKIKMAL